MADDVEAFLGSFERLDAAVGPRSQLWYVGNVLENLTDPETVGLVNEVARLGGAAQAASSDSGIVTVLNGAPMDPLFNWRSAFIPNHPNTVRLVEDHCQQLIGRYRQSARDARVRESGITGMVARFVRFPSDVREAAGLETKAGQTSAFVVGVVAQVIAALVAAGLLTLIGTVVAHLVGR
jgi:hypothetical protein